MVESLSIRVKDLLKEDILKKMYVIVHKTESIFNRDLKELPEIQRIVQHYISEYPFLADLKVEIKGSFPNCYYDPIKKSFVFGFFNSVVVAHEFSHAVSMHDSPVYAGTLMASKAIAALTSLANVPVALGGALLKGVNPEYKSGVNKLQDILSIIHGTTYLPTLYEEGKANLHAALTAKDKAKALATVLPSMGSYLTAAALPILIYQGRRLYEKGN